MVLFKKERYSQGYTLVEIMVSLTIIAIIFGTGYAAFREFSRRQVISSVIRELVGNLRLAQSQALAGKKPSTLACQDPNRLQGYGFRVTSANSYRIEAACSGGDEIVKEVTVPSEVDIVAPAQNPIIFKVLGEGTNLSNDTSIVISAYDTSRSLVVTVGGTIE